MPVVFDENAEDAEGAEGAEVARGVEAQPVVEAAVMTPTSRYSLLIIDSF
jgi:hypothetical protein